MVAAKQERDEALADVRAVAYQLNTLDTLLANLGVRVGEGLTLTRRLERAVPVLEGMAEALDEHDELDQLLREAGPGRNKPA